MKKSAIDIKSIIFVGGNIVISANDYSTLQIKEFAFEAKARGLSLTIRNATRLTTPECKSIAYINPGKITFDFSV